MKTRHYCLRNGKGPEVREVFACQVCCLIRWSIATANEQLLALQYSNDMYKDAGADWIKVEKDGNGGVVEVEILLEKMLLCTMLH